MRRGTPMGEPSPIMQAPRVAEHPSDECGTEGDDMKWRG